MKKHKSKKEMGTYYKRINEDENTEYWSFIEQTANNYPKYIIEGAISGVEGLAYVVFDNPFGEAEVNGADGVEEITEAEFTDAFSAVGSRPPAKPRP